jgi:hypothetical protein
MTEPKSREEVKAELAEIINKRIVAGEADSSVVLATTILSFVVPVLEDIAKHLEQIPMALGPDLAGNSVSERLHGIEMFLYDEVKPLMRQILGTKQ